MKFWVVAAAAVLVSCSRDPNVAKQRYLENGNKYFARGKYKEASIMYRNALQKDQRYGTAYYHLGLADLKLGRIPNALGELRRGIELIPKDQPEHIDAEIKLSEIYLAFTREPQFLAEVDAITKDLLQRDPNSYDGHRLIGDLDYARAQNAFQTARPQDAGNLLDSSIAEYQKAAADKPPTPQLQMALARALAAREHWTDAEQLYQQVIDRDKTFIQAYNELYRLYLVEKKFPEAERTLRAGAAGNPKQVSFLITLASLYLSQHRQDDMTAVLNQIKAHGRDYPRAHLIVGDFYFRNGENREALREYKEGMGADSKQIATYQKRMIEVLMRENKRAEAADINAAILKANPKDSDARGLQATFLLDRGDVQKAISELQAVVNAAPDNFVARYNLGRAHLARGEWEQARQQFTQAIQQRPDYIMARLALAQLQIMRGEYDAAMKSADAILQIDKRNGQARMIQGAALLGQRKYAEARQLFESLKPTNPNGVDLDLSLGVVSLKEGKYAEAEQGFRKAYAANPKETRALTGLVEALAAQDHVDQAIALMQAELAKNPTRQDLQMALGNLAARAGRFDLAVAQFQAVLNEMDKNSRARGEVFIRLGVALRNKGDLNGAINVLAKAREVLPDNALVIEELALALQHADRMNEARLAYEQALKLDPQNGYALNNLAFLIADSGAGDLDQALTYAQRAKQVLPNHNDVSDTLGWIYLKKNMSDSALDTFQGLVNKAPDNPTFHYHLAMAFAQKGDKPRALKELQQALHDSPRKDEETKIRDMISKLQS